LNEPWTQDTDNKNNRKFDKTKDYSCKQLRAVPTGLGLIWVTLTQGCAALALG
jgi:hypothetical protein